LGFGIFTINPNFALQYTASVQIAKSGAAAYDPASFSTAPTSVTAGVNFDTVSWTNPGTPTITWKSNITGIQPGQVIPVASGGTVSYTTSLGSGSIAIPEVEVYSDQIIQIAPSFASVTAGNSAQYTLTLKNPTPSAVTYNLAVTGIPSSWVSLAPSANVAASGQSTTMLTITPDSAALGNLYNFVVTAMAASGATGVVQAGFSYSQGPNAGGSQSGGGGIGSIVSTNALGVSVSLTPVSNTAGQGGTTNYTVQLTNAGNVADTYNLTANVPAGVTATFDQPSIQVQPGLSNFRQTILHLAVTKGTPAGAPTFTVIATSSTNSSIAGQTTGTLNISAHGVTLALNPSTTNPSTTVQLQVTNTGTTSDTFNLTLGGPAALNSSLQSSSVALASGQSTSLPIQVGAMTFA